MSAHLGTENMDFQYKVGLRQLKGSGDSQTQASFEPE